MKSSNHRSFQVNYFSCQQITSDIRLSLSRRGRWPFLEFLSPPDLARGRFVGSCGSSIESLARGAGESHQMAQLCGPAFSGLTPGPFFFTYLFIFYHRCVFLFSYNGLHLESSLAQRQTTAGIPQPFTLKVLCHFLCTVLVKTRS